MLLQSLLHGRKTPARSTLGSVGFSPIRETPVGRVGALDAHGRDAGFTQGLALGQCFLGASP